MSTARTRSRHAQQGQSLVEVAVLAAILVPLFLLIPVIAKYIHLQRSTQMAARAAAWDATVGRDYALPNRAQARNHLVDRHFATAAAPIRTNVPSPPANARLGNVFLNTFSNQPLLESGDIRLQAYSDEAAPGFLARVPVVAPNPKGLMSATVRVNPQNLKTQDGRPAAYLAPFDSIGLQMTRSQTLLADAWNAKGPGHGARPHPRSVLAQLDFAPPDHLRPLGNAIDKLSFREGLPFVGVPTRLQLGYMEPDIVPHDRLEPYVRGY